MTAKTDDHDSLLDPAINNARGILNDWQASKES